MITIRVLFQGLISHYGDALNGPKRFATMIKAPRHVARVKWFGGTLNLTGREVLRFDPEPGAGAAPDLAFQARVPHLQHLTRKNSGGAVGKHPTLAKDHTNASGYFRYRDGVLGVASLFDYQGEYCLDGGTIWGPTCIADWVALIISFNADQVLLKEGRIAPNKEVDDPLISEVTRATFTRDSQIFVTNNPPHSHPPSGPQICDEAAPPQHWRHHRLVTDADRIAGLGWRYPCPETRLNDSSDRRDGGDEARDRRANPAVVVDGDIECSNSQWP